MGWQRSWPRWCCTGGTWQHSTSGMGAGRKLSLRRCCDSESCGKTRRGFQRGHSQSGDSLVAFNCNAARGDRGGSCHESSARETTCYQSLRRSTEKSRREALPPPASLQHSLLTKHHRVLAGKGKTRRGHLHYSRTGNEGYTQRWNAINRNGAPMFTLNCVLVLTVNYIVTWILKVLRSNFLLV